MINHYESLSEVHGLGIKLKWIGSFLTTANSNHDGAVRKQDGLHCQQILKHLSLVFPISAFVGTPYVTASGWRAGDPWCGE